MWYNGHAECSGACGHPSHPRIRTNRPAGERTPVRIIRQAATARRSDDRARFLQAVGYRAEDYR